MKKILLLLLMMCALLVSCSEDSTTDNTLSNNTEKVDKVNSDKETSDNEDSENSDSEESKNDEDDDDKPSQDNDDTAEEENTNDETDEGDTTDEGVDNKEDEDENDEGNGDDSTVTNDPITLPTSFTKRVLYEKASGTWCAWCTGAIDVLYNIEDEIGKENVVAISYQADEEMEVQQGYDLVEALGNVAGYPMAAVDRKSDYSAFQGIELAFDNAVSQSKNSAECGVQIDVTGDSIIVNAGFLNDISGDIRLSVIIVENGLIFDQANAYNNDPNSAFYQKGSTIKDFEFNHIFRKVVTDGLLGETVDADEKSVTRFAFYDEFDGYIKENCSIVVLIADKDQEVLNVAQCHVGEKISW